MVHDLKHKKTNYIVRDFWDTLHILVLCVYVLRSLAGFWGTR